MGGMGGTRKDTSETTEHVAVIMSVLSRDDCKEIRYNSLQKQGIESNRETLMDQQENTHCAMRSAE